jgi:uncharacterized protein YjdB
MFIHLEAVQKVLLNTPMGNEKANQYKNNNNWITMNKTYSQIIYDVARNINMSPIHLASRIKQENSGDVVNKPAINGSYPGYEGYYNFCNINAVPGANGNSAVTNALIHAKNNGWTNPELSISGCASTIFNKYIYWGQNTIYFQKFDVNNPGQATVLYGSQYMTNIVAPINESKISYDAYKAASMINMPFEFHIPVYNNMPSIAAPYPYTNEVYYQQDYTKVYLDDPNDSGVDDVFSLRATPSSNAITLKTLTFNDGNKTNNTSDYIITRIEKGIGTNWDKVRVKVKSTGEVTDGYIYQSYVYNLNYTKVDSITLDKTDINLNVNGTAKLNATINPSNAWYKDYSYTSSNSNIATVDGNGNVVAKSLGNAIITVTTEDQNKSFSCNITVSNSVQSITLDKSSYKLLKDNYLIIVPNVLPESATNKSYTIVSSNENIVKVEDNRLKGINLGTANVTFRTVENNKEVTVPIEVIDQSSFNVSVDNSLKLENSYVSKVSPSTKVNDIKAKINTTLNIEVRNKNNVILSDDSAIGTGTNINILDVNNNVVLTYTIIIYGDVDGDGNIKSTDYVKIKNHIMEVSSIKSIELISGDVNRDSKISSSDYVLIKNSIMNDNASIVQ